MAWYDFWKDIGSNIQNGVNNFVQWVDERNDKNKDTGGQKVEYNQETTPSTTPSTTTTTAPTTGSGFTYKDFQTSDTTNDFLNAYNNWKAQGAPVYADSYQGTLNGIMNDIMNGKPFSWDMNGDALYQQYKDMYTNQANLGMQNAMAQAAALTGGYGSSYGQAVGQQAYAQQMQGLNDVALDLHDRAYGQYQDQRADLYNQYGMYSDLANQEYNEWLNAVNLYNQEGDKLYGQYMDSYNNDLNTYNTDKGIAYDEYTRAQDYARADEVWKRERDAAEEDWNKMYGDLKFDEEGNVIGGGYYNKKDHEDKLAAEEEWNKMYGDFERNEDGSIKLDENGNPVGGGIYTRENWQAEQAAAAEAEAANPNTTYEGEGMLNGQQVPKTLANVPGLTTVNTKYFDEIGNFINAAVVSGKDGVGNSITGTPKVGQGTMTYNIGGKEVTLQTGTSPYTNTVNPDAKNGVFDNGYQPDNVKGIKLEECEGLVADINGQEVQVYYTEDKQGNIQGWVYDAANNEYREVDIDPSQVKRKSQEPNNTLKNNPNGKVGGGGATGNIDRQMMT